MNEEQKRERLVKFLDQKAFDPILSKSADKYRGHEKEIFEILKKSTESEKRRFHDNYHTAKDVRDNYLSDLNSRTAQKKNRELEELGLPRLPQFRDEFMDLCERLGL
jgi:hypothetical protein